MTTEKEALKFVQHIERHLREMEQKNEDESRGYTLKGTLKVMCKICNKTIDEIVESEDQ